MFQSKYKTKKTKNQNSIRMIFVCFFTYTYKQNVYNKRNFGGNTPTNTHTHTHTNTHTQKQKSMSA